MLPNMYLLGMLVASKHVQRVELTDAMGTGDGVYCEIPFYFNYGWEGNLQQGIKLGQQLKRLKNRH